MSARQKKPAQLLEAFAEACTTAATAQAPHGRSLSWEQRDRFVYFHCPLPGLRGPHGWNGGPRASAWIGDGAVHATCQKCVGQKGDYQDQAEYEAAREAYTDQVKRAIRWTEDGVTHAAFDHEVLRTHDYYDRDFRHLIRRLKIRYKDGRKEAGNHNPWWWRAAPLSGGTIGDLQAIKAEEWLARNYPEHDRIYDALCWYGIDRFIDGAATKVLTAAAAEYLPCTAVLTEGEKDADSFNSLMAAAGLTDLMATCLCSPKPMKLASHHARLLAWRDVVIIGDTDEPGRQHAENWTTIAWPHARTVKLVREQLGLPGTPESKDLTDWIVERIGAPPPGRELQDWIRAAPYGKGAAEELLAIIAAAAPLVEPIGIPTEWRVGMMPTKHGTPKMDSPHNAMRIWTMHPSLKGRVRTNLRSGEVEVVDAPWGERLTVGAHGAALACAEWLEHTERLSMSVRVLEDMLSRDAAAPPFNPLAGMLETVWDGVPRIDALFTRYLPLDVDPVVAAALAQITIGDLVMKLRGAHHAQRVLVGIGTSLPLDVVGALLGRFGMQHRGRLADRHIEQYACHEVAALQISMEPVGNRQAALVSIPVIFAPHVLAKQRLLSTPLVIAAGELPVDDRTRDKVDPRCYLLELAGDPKLHALAQDADQVLAEGVARLADLLRVEVPHGVMTIEEKRAFEVAEHTLRGIWVYATREVSEIDFSTPRAMISAPLRAEPRRHIVRLQFLETMRLWMLDHYRDGQSQERAFNAACKAMGWCRSGKTPSVSITGAVAGSLRLDIAGRRKADLPGVLLTDERLEELADRLFQTESSGNSGSSGNVQVASNGAESLGSGILVEAFVHEEEKSDEIASPARTYAYIYSKGRGPQVSPRVLQGEAAIEKARSILAIEGVVGIDFETYPTAPKWHGDQASAGVEKGKGAAREKAERDATLKGRAHLREPCTLQLRHEQDGPEFEAFIRLTNPVEELPRIFEGARATLVAHNAQHEVEILLKHKVALDVNCTLLAAKILFLTAVPPDQPQPVSFSLSALVEKEFEHKMDKSIRDRDWRRPESLDDEAVEYGLDDVRWTLKLWKKYEKLMKETEA